MPYILTLCFRPFKLLHYFVNLCSLSLDFPVADLLRLDSSGVDEIDKLATDEVFEVNDCTLPAGVKVGAVS